MMHRNTLRLPHSPTPILPKPTTLGTAGLKSTGLLKNLLFFLCYGWGLNRCLGCLHGLVQLELGCDPAGLTDLASLAALSNLRRLALRGLSLEAGE
jgi:hypothetical protein